MTVPADQVLPDDALYPVGNFPAGDLQVVLNWLDTEWGAGAAVTAGTLATVLAGAATAAAAGALPWGDICYVVGATIVGVRLGTEAVAS